MRVSRSFCVLSFLALSACAVGVELGAPRELPDAGRDASAQGDGRMGGAATTGSGRGGASSASSTSTGSGAGGMSGAGASSTGGAGFDASGSGGVTIDGAPNDAIVAVDTSNGCVAGQKSCNGRCSIPEARIGCGLTGCDPCPSPAHAIANCSGTECDFSCLSGYVRSGSECVIGDGGGSGGSGGSMGDGGHCVASQCGGCIPVIQAPCCKPDDTCGCQYPFFPCM
jgi:hypothetical protein